MIVYRISYKLMLFLLRLSSHFVIIIVLKMCAADPLAFTSIFICLYFDILYVVESF